MAWALPKWVLWQPLWKTSAVRVRALPTAASSALSPSMDTVIIFSTPGWSSPLESVSSMSM